jgi:hypothetical protein
LLTGEPRERDSHAADVHLGVVVIVVLDPAHAHGVELAWHDGVGFNHAAPKEKEQHVRQADHVGRHLHADQAQ